MNGVYKQTVTSTANGLILQLLEASFAINNSFSFMEIPVKKIR